MKRPDRPTVLRWSLIALTAWLLPSYGTVGMFTVADVVRSGGLYEGLFDPALLLAPPLFGLIVGLPSWITGFGLWALAHRFGRSSAAVAALIGTIAPLPLLAWYLHEHWTMNSYLPTDRRIALLLNETPLVFSAVAIGALTGWLIWRIAYPSVRPLADPRQP